MKSSWLQCSIILWVSSSLIVTSTGFLSRTTTAPKSRTNIAGSSSPSSSLLRLSSSSAEGGSRKIPITTKNDDDKDDDDDDIAKDTCDVAIFGGGFGGLYTALAMAQELQRQNNNNRRRGRQQQQQQLDIALVTPGDNFVFLPLLYDLTMGTASELEVCPTYKSILSGTGIRHIKATLDDFEGPDGYSAQLTTTTTASAKNKNDDDDAKKRKRLSFRASVIAVGATPQSILESVPGAKDHTQPYYTKDHAKETDRLLTKLGGMEKNDGIIPRIAVVGGGYGGVELATCVKRRIPNSVVCLLTRGAPMKGTRAEPLINAALKRLEVKVQECSVESVESVVVQVEDGDHHLAEKKSPKSGRAQVIVKTGPPPGSSSSSSSSTDGEEDANNNIPWDAVLWTAGSGPAYPIVEGLDQLSKVEPSGRLSIDGTLRCIWKEERRGLRNNPRVWAMGDCAEIMVKTTDGKKKYTTPKTAQAAMQQADVVANNILVELGMLPTRSSSAKTFQYQDLGTMMTLGGPNGAVFAPSEDTPLAALFAPAIDIARVGFGIADGILGGLTKSQSGEKTDLGETVENLGLSLGGYGLGVDPDAAPGTLAGTLSGAARRAVYALRMPTNRQRIYAATSAAISTVNALAKEANALNNNDDKDKDKQKP
jgi:NADH:ubiquinone reductase (non-electrogenic)